MPWGDSFVSGFQAGNDARDRKKRRQLEEAEQAMKKELTQKELDQHAAEFAANKGVRDAQAANLNAEASRTTRLTPAQEAEFNARVAQLGAETQRTQALTPAQAAETNARTANIAAETNRTTRLTPAQEAEFNARVAQLGAETQRTQTLTPALADEANARAAELKSHAGYYGGKSQPAAKVTQAFGEGEKSRIEYGLPVDQAQRMAGVAAYKSPYAEDIADLGRQISDHQAEMEGGDNRTGFLNVTSRQDLIDKATRQRRRLQAMELQDQLGKGVIDQAEADRRANLIRKGAL